MSQVTVTIDGKSYRMACEAGQEEHLNDLAEKFDKYVMSLRSQFGEIGDQRLTVMAGIMVMDELSETQGKLKGVQSELDLVKTTRDNALQNAEKMDASVAGTLSTLATQIAGVADKLNKNS